MYSIPTNFNENNNLQTIGSSVENGKITLTKQFNETLTELDIINRKNAILAQQTNIKNQMQNLKSQYENLTVQTIELDKLLEQISTELPTLE